MFHVKIDEETHKLLKIEAAKRGGTMGNLIREAVASLGEPAPKPLIAHDKPPRMRHEKWHRMLDDILDSGDKEAIGAVCQNLAVFHRVSRRAQDGGQEKTG